MLGLLSYLRRWGDGPAPRYEVPCGCGHALRGFRRRRRQVLRCPACGRKVFVLARSPLPPTDVNAALSPPSPGRRPKRLGAWRFPLTAGAATLAILLVIFIAAAPFLGRPAPPHAQDEPFPDLAGRMAAGRLALAQGDFHLAAREMQTALDLGRRRPDALSSADRQELVQLERQSDLLSRLSSRSLQEIVGEADPVLHDEEWRARFTRDYQGQSVLFDDAVRFDDSAPATGRRRPVLVNYRIVVDGETVRLALEDLDILQGLPLERPRRLLFGGRLAKVEREESGRWMVGFIPDSGVLLTDRGAAEAVCSAPVDQELLEVLKRQQRWLERPTP